MHGLLRDPPTSAPPLAGVETRTDRAPGQGPGSWAKGLVRLVSPGDHEAKGESRRVTFAFITLVIVSFVALNIGIYQSARSRLIDERWDQLANTVDEKRKDVRAVLHELENEAQFISGEDDLRRWAGESGAPTALGTLERERRLDRAASAFALNAIDLVAPNGDILASTTQSALWRTPASAAVSREVLTTGIGEVHAEYSEFTGKPMIIAAAPIVSSQTGSIAGVALLYTGMDERFGQSLTEWVLPGQASGSYLALQRDDEVMIATQPPTESGLYLGQRLPLSSVAARAASSAALGVESRVEMPGTAKNRMWAVTRSIPELGCGLVGQADEATMLTGLRSTLFGLLVLDIGVALLGVMLMLSWRRQVQAQMAHREFALSRQHTERIQTVLDSAFDAILSLDGAGHVVTANRAAERLFQRSEAEMASQPVHRILDWNRETLRAAAAATGTPGKVARSEALRPDGSALPVEVSVASSGEGDGLIYTVVARDVSDRIEAEHKIQTFAEGLEISNHRLEQANSQLEQASRLKSEFLANTSHELRTPLNGIMGFLQLVLDGLCDTPEEEREFLGQALQCSKHLLGLINDVLDIAKIEAGRLSFEFTPVDVQTLFDEVYTVTHVQAQQKGLKLRFEPVGSECPPVRADLGKVKQVLINLIGNSLKFTPSGGITVRAIPSQSAGHVLFEVVDTGIGIPEDRQAAIFEKFTQADGSTTRRYGGTGLGLSISQSLVELQGGVIGVESAGVGQGTRMYFSLPVWRTDVEPEPAEAIDGPPPEVISGPPGGPLILIVEDDSVFRLFVVALLQQHGYRTVVASHAEAGWLLARKLRPSLVLLDYALSCLEGAVLRTGWDLAERMATDPKTRRIPFVFVTGFEGELHDKLKSVTFVRQPRHLPKPVESKRLLGQVHEALGGAPVDIVRVLLADDDPTVVAFVTKVLGEERFQIDVVNNGEECLHLLRTHPRAFDLLLLDLMMPDVSGYDVLREMALSGVAAKLPVIVLTNYPEARNEDERRLLEEGIVLDILAKADVHDRPDLLPFVINHHLLGHGSSMSPGVTPLEVERFHMQVPAGDASTEDGLALERFERAPKGASPGAPPRGEGHRRAA